MKLNIKNFYNQYVRMEDKQIFFLTGVLFSLAILLFLINVFTNQFHGDLFYPPIWFFFAPVVLAVLMLGMYAIDISPRAALGARAYGTFFFAYLAVTLLSTAIQYTPFPPIDHWLLHLDQAVGFSTPALLSWTHNHPIIHLIFALAYTILYPELFIVPLILVLLLAKKAIDRYLLILLISALIGSLIYYFFPTTAPASVIHNPYFFPAEHDTALKFYQIHHHLKVTTVQGGLIAFPSFHVIWAITMTYVFHGRKWFFYPVLVLNTIIILSTMFLGWHYLTDVIAGIIIALISIYITEYLLKKALKLHK